MIDKIVKCSENISKADFNLKNDEDKTDMLKYYDKKSTSICLRRKSLSSRILDFKKLKELFLYHNEFDEIPAVLSKLRELELLNVYGNRLKSFQAVSILAELLNIFI